MAARQRRPVKPARYRQTALPPPLLLRSSPSDPVARRALPLNPPFLPEGLSSSSRPDRSVPPPTPSLSGLLDAVAPPPHRLHARSA
ncbi:hypothetical protein ABZP36_005097 [Zizania latifolia]